jgi:hypothetical protein
MENFLYSIVPDAIPYPLIAEALFVPFRLIGLIAGAVLAVIIFNQSKKQGYTRLLWAYAFNTLGVFGVLILIYLCLFYYIPSPPFWMLITEATLYLILHILLAISVIVFLLMAPPRLFNGAKAAVHWLISR